ncbi:hypothetical protein [Staphylococcus pseudintermedius]|uniref:hypothetical protein n=1 Tax=Staphylococcus pseudintermedius TaxID=283734 RepID=UPI001BDF7D5C|nr:hypothetical protein [Staphylococcus pseudintermedius]
MKNIFKVSALSISLGLVGLAGSQAYAAEGTPETQSNDFDGVNYVHNENVFSQYDMINEEALKQAQPKTTTQSTKATSRTHNENKKKKEALKQAQPKTTTQSTKATSRTHNENIFSQYDMINEEALKQAQPKTTTQSTKATSRTHNENVFSAYDMIN